MYFDRIIHCISRLILSIPGMSERLGGSILGLLLTGCDVISSRKQELEHIWKRPFQLTLVRGLFILARYLAIAIHIICSLQPKSSRWSISPGSDCRRICWVD
ncbi:hypothetical protein GYMLUDRAFT_463566 [Collybiopsis luxurians FD-317 M1]|uniref:Uncharacterized protein n=1 Tax=Collybiopsis luxurians FD-317 M1 TaxID=944289 RepID=A0A0D0CK81_9AGAR|nr:hypothetical protein GYMLUDRAFT_463566 [Collybiopsis luxurians FD-317 M1]